MSIDRRIRDGLERSSRSMEMSSDVGLPDAIDRGRRKRRVRTAVRATAAAGFVAAAVLLAPTVADLVRDIGEREPATTPSPTASDFGAIAGIYTTTIPGDGGIVREYGLAGTWTLRLLPNGTVLLSAPDTFGGAPTGIAFEITRDRFRTNAFANDLCGEQAAGTYRWQRTGGELTFTLVTDPCRPRVALFTSVPWTAAG